LRRQGDLVVNNLTSSKTIALTDAAFESPAKQHWRLLHLVWRLRRTIGDCRTSFGI